MRSRLRRRVFGLVAIGCLWTVGAAAESPAPAASAWRLPEPGSCAPQGGVRGWPLGSDGVPLPFSPGDVLGIHVLESLRGFLPDAVWELRDRFFFEGMRLEIGPCFADYSAPDFYHRATRDFAGQARLLANGGIERYVAGRPFPADSIDPGDPSAGLRWAWNVELRYRGAGFRGPFRISDLRATGRADAYEAEIFQIQLAFRSDERARDYRAAGARSRQWVAGGLFREPAAAREFAWRQYRDVASLIEPGRSDDVYAWVPGWRRVKRISATQVEGLYMPSFSLGTPQAGQMGAPGVDVSAGVAIPAGTDGIATRRSGFEGLELRPLDHDWAVLGVQDVLVPINAATPSWPEVRDRDFGPSGLSFASDRWDLRRAIVLEARAREVHSDTGVARAILYLDLQTLVPLFYQSFDRRGERIDVGIFAGRWSETRSDYPRWPDDPARAVRVIDPVGAAFANVDERGSWRRESWTFVSTPPDDATLERWLSVGDLAKRR